MRLLAATLALMLAFSTPSAVWAQTSTPVQEPEAERAETLLVFQDTDIRDVLRLIAQEYDLNIVISDDVTGTVTLRLKETSLANTLEAILIPKGYDYEIRDNIIRVAPQPVLEAERVQRRNRLSLEPLVSEVITLSYLDANDVKPSLDSIVSKRGSVTVLEERQHKGFRFGSSGTGTSGAGGGSSSSGSGTGAVNFGDPSSLLGGRIDSEAEEKPRSDTLLVVDVPESIAKIKEILAKLDIPPRQVLIDAKVLEVDTESLEDLGLDFDNDVTFDTHGGTNTLASDLNSAATTTTVSSNAFTNTFPTDTDAGLHMVFTKLNGEDLTFVLHALLQDQRTKTLSAPQILTVENQEAAILVGEQFPIFEANVTDQGTTTESLSFYLPVGVSLQVIVRVTPADDVIMIIHPSVTSVGAFVTGTSGLTQPRINIREADTRVVIKNGDTLVIGGLLQDVVDERYFRVPVLGHLPLLGRLFTRRQLDIDQKNLLIFITPKVVDQGGGLTAVQKWTLDGIKDPAGYGTLNERRAAIQKIFKSAQKNYTEKKYELAKLQLLRIMAMEPQHPGALDLLGKMGVLPEEKPAA